MMNKPIHEYPSHHSRELLIELVSQFGNTKEVREYLQRFSNVRQHRFCVIKAGGQVLEDSMGPLVRALAFLRFVGLFPIVLHGGGPQIDRALSAAGIETERVDGMRVTPEEVLRIVRRVLRGECMRLVEALDSAGVRAHACQHGVFLAKPRNPRKYGYVGEVAGVDIRAIRQVVQFGALPIVSPVGEAPDGRSLNINADVAMRALVKAVQPYKIVFLTGTGGLLDRNGRVIPAINLATDYQDLMAADWVHSGMRLKLAEIKGILDALPGMASVSMTSAERLTRELFSHTGAGTLIRRGESFETLTELNDAARKDIRKIVEGCFGRKLQERWFDRLQPKEIIISKSRRALAAIAQGHGGMSYLDKFAVLPEAQGMGLANALIGLVKERHPHLYWRSRSNNPINHWYFQQAELSWRGSEWLVFGIGAGNLQQFDACRVDALARPDSFV